MTKVLLCLIYMAVWMDTVSGQVTYTASFTRTLEKAGIEYAEPAEQWLHVTIPPDHVYMDYDLVLQNDRNDFEVRYAIHFNRKNAIPVPPSVEVSRLLANIASNDEVHDILIRIPPDSVLREAYNADIGMIAHFTPKEDFSEKAFGALISLYTDAGPSIDIVLLYSDPDYDPLNMYRSVRFAGLRQEKK